MCGSVFLIKLVKAGHIFDTMPPNWKLFPSSKLHEIEPLKGYMVATTTR